MALRLAHDHILTKIALNASVFLLNIHPLHREANKEKSPVNIVETGICGGEAHDGGDSRRRVPANYGLGKRRRLRLWCSVGVSFGRMTETLDGA